MAGIRCGPRADVGIGRIGGVVEIEVDGLDGGVVGIDGCSRPLSREGEKLVLSESLVKL